MSSLRRLVLAVVLILSAGVVAARAQVVMVRSAAPGAAISLTLNGGAAVTAKGDENGDATLAVPARGRDTEIQLHVDACDNAVKVVINEPGVVPAGADAGCTRKDLWGVYIMRTITTFVIEMNGTDSTVYVAQGPPPREWLERGVSRADRLWGTAGKGLVLSAGAGLSIFSEGLSGACGNIATCTASTGFGFQLSAEYWIKPHFAAWASYLRPNDTTAIGSGDTFQFDTSRTLRVFMVGGKGGVPVGHGRVYGLGGWNHHEATDSTSETVNDQTITVNGVATVLPGGTQNFGQKTRGWGWVAGGGYDLYLRDWFVVYAELTEVILKGSSTNLGAATIDERSTFVFGGVRLRIGK